MKPGNIVTWKSRFGMDLPTDLGIIIEFIPYDFRGRDPFPWWRVLFGMRGVLMCRESDLMVLDEDR